MIILTLYSWRFYYYLFNIIIRNDINNVNTNKLLLGNYIQIHDN